MAKYTTAEQAGLDRLLAIQPAEGSEDRRLEQQDDCRYCRQEGKACGRAHVERMARSWRTGETLRRRTPTTAELQAPVQPSRRGPGAGIGAGYRAPRKASPKQIDFLKKLLQDKDLSGTAYSNFTDEFLTAMTSVDASRCIDDLKTRPRRSQGPQVAFITEDGWYLHEDVVYKVQRAVHGSGNLYAKKLLVDEGHGSWEYAPGAVCKLQASEKMTLEDAQRFGRLYGMCCSCGATLTNEVSIKNGIGPICGQHFGL